MMAAMRSWKKWLSLGFLSMLGTGFLPKAPGTFASILAVPILLLLRLALPTGVDAKKLVLFAVFAALSWLSVLAIRIAVTDGEYDKSYIVIDEFLGMMISLLPVFFLGRLSWSLVVAGLLLFRLLDIWKPLGIRKIDQENTPFSVILDDIAAGAIVCVLLVMFLAASASTVPIR